MRAVGSTGLEVFHDEWYKDSKAPYYHSDEEKNELLRTSDALKGHRTEIASFFADHEDKNERADFIKTFFDNTFTEMILSNGQRAGYRAFDTVFMMWRGSASDPDHPTLGWISPDIFIRLAEKNRLISQITELQLRRVCRFLRENPALRASIANVKINLSPLDLIHSDGGSHLIRILDEYGLPYSCFQFEITETVATEYSASLTRVAESFQAAGIGLCLDDFGSGYANLNTVMQLPFSVIKLDRSLLFHICTDKNAALFYQSIVSAFCRLGYRIIAEGVETQAEMELLRSWNVDMIQGYYFSRPLPPGDLLRLLTEEAVEQM